VGTRTGTKRARTPDGHCGIRRSYIWAVTADAPDLPATLGSRSPDEALLDALQVATILHVPVGCVRDHTRKPHGIPHIRLTVEFRERVRRQRLTAGRSATPVMRGQ